MGDHVELEEGDGDVEVVSGVATITGDTAVDGDGEGEF